MAFVKKVSGRDGENLSIGAHRINRNKKVMTGQIMTFFVCMDYCMTAPQTIAPTRQTTDRTENSS